MSLAKPCAENYAGSGAMNSKPKQNPLRDRTTAGTLDRKGRSNSSSSRSPGFNKMPAYRTMPPSLISVPRPATTVVEKPFEVTTRTGKSTGRRLHRRVCSASIAIQDGPARELLQITKGKLGSRRRYTLQVSKIRGRSERVQGMNPMFSAPKPRSKRWRKTSSPNLRVTGFDGVYRLGRQSRSSLQPSRGRQRGSGACAV